MRPRIKASAQQGRVLNSGFFSKARELGDHLVVYQPGYSRDTLDTAKYVMLLAHQRAPHNPHLPAMFQLADGSVACARYDKHAEGLPRPNYESTKPWGHSRHVTRHSVREIAKIMHLTKSEADALHVIVDVVQSMPKSAQESALWDLHNNNIMYDSAGALVFVDPVCFIHEF